MFLPLFYQLGDAGSLDESDSLSGARRPTHAAAVAVFAVNRTFLVGVGVQYRSKLADHFAGFAAGAFIPICLGDIFRLEKQRHLIFGEGFVSQAVLVAVADAADERGFKSPHRMHQPLFIQFS